MTTADVLGIVLLVVWVLAAVWSARTEEAKPMWRSGSASREKQYPLRDGSGTSR